MNTDDVTASRETSALDFLICLYTFTPFTNHSYEYVAAPQPKHDPHDYLKEDTKAVYPWAYELPTELS